MGIEGVLLCCPARSAASKLIFFLQAQCSTALGLEPHVLNEVDATFVQAFLRALRRTVRLTSSAVTCQRTFRSVWYVETKVVLESKLSKPLWCWSRKSSPRKGQRHPKGPNGTHAHTSMQNGRSVDYLVHCTVGEVIDDLPKCADLPHHKLMHPY